MVGKGAIKTAIAAMGAACPHSSIADDMMGELREARLADEAAAAAAACTKAVESFRIISIPRQSWHCTQGGMEYDTIV